MHIWTHCYWRSFLLGFIYIPTDDFCSQWYLEIALGPLSIFFSNKPENY
jgi:hypothetical protein